MKRISPGLDVIAQAQAQASTSPAVTPPPRNRDAKSPKLPAFIDAKDEMDSYLLRFEHCAENASWEKNTWAIKLSALTGRAMEVYTRMSDNDANDNDKLKKALLTRPCTITQKMAIEKDPGKPSQRLKKRQYSSSIDKRIT